ncbi:MAG: Uma2 family endonuclease [Chloroflexota bacterium]
MAETFRNFELLVTDYPFAKHEAVAVVNSDGVPPSYGPDGKISYEAFLDWADEDTHAEWVDGVISMTSPASYKHQDALSFLVSLLRLFTEASDLGKVLPAGYQMKLSAGGAGREPDVLFITKAHLNRITPNYLDGPADLAIELVSPGTYHQARDRKDKFAEYARGGVLEYWIIDPEQKQAEFYHLDPNKKYQSILPDAEGKVFSEVVSGFWFKTEWLWRKPLPPVQKVLRKVGGATYEAYLKRQALEDDEL